MVFNKTLKRCAGVPPALAVALAVLTFGPASQIEALAQTSPSKVEPGQLEKSLSAPDKVGEPKLAPKPAQTEIPKSITPGGAEAITFVLKGLSVEGSGVYKSGVLSGLAKEKFGNQVSVADIFRIADKMTARYRNDGYLLTTVVVPPQKIDDGKVVLKVVEGFVDRVVVEGLPKHHQAKIKRYLKKVVGKRPLKSSTLERYLLLVDDLPGIDVQSFMQPSTDNGGAATLTVKPKMKRLSGWAAANNRGREVIGPYQMTLGVRVNTLAHLGQSLTGQVVTTPEDHDELKHVNMSFGQELGTEGTTVILSASAMLSEPGEELEALELESQSMGFDLMLRTKPFRSRGANLFFSITGSVREAETEALDADLSEDRSRAVKLSAELQTLDSTGATSLAFDANRGIDLLGATQDGSTLLSRGDAKAEATWFGLRLSRAQRLSRVAGLHLSARGQYSMDALSASREFAVGGEANASAFDASEILGDHGVSGRLELRVTPGLSGLLASEKRKDWVRASGLQLIAFGDGGYVWQKSSSAALGQQDARIASAGIGARFNAGSYVSGSIEAAMPFLKTVESQGNRDPRVFFRLSARF